MNDRPPLDYAAACADAADRQGITAIVDILAAAGFTADVEQTGGFTMVAVIDAGFGHIALTDDGDWLVGEYHEDTWTTGPGEDATYRSVPQDHGPDALISAVKAALAGISAHARTVLATLPTTYDTMSYWTRDDTGADPIAVGTSRTGTKIVVTVDHDGLLIGEYQHYTGEQPLTTRGGIRSRLELEHTLADMGMGPAARRPLITGAQVAAWHGEGWLTSPQWDALADRISTDTAIAGRVADLARQITTLH